MMERACSHAFCLRWLLTGLLAANFCTTFLSAEDWPEWRGKGVVYYIESRRFLIRDSPRPATTYEQKTGGADGVKGA